MLQEESDLAWQRTMDPRVSILCMQTLEPVFVYASMYSRACLCCLLSRARVCVPCIHADAAQQVQQLLIQFPLLLAHGPALCQHARTSMHRRSRRQRNAKE